MTAPQTECAAKIAKAVGQSVSQFQYCMPASALVTSMMRKALLRAPDISPIKRLERSHGNGIPNAFQPRHADNERNVFNPGDA